MAGFRPRPSRRNQFGTDTGNEHGDDALYAICSSCGHIEMDITDHCSSCWGDTLCRASPKSHRGDWFD